MRRFFRLLAVVFAAVLLLAACAPNTPEAIDSLQNPAMSGVENTPAGAAVALVTDEVLLESAFGQGVWNSISHFAGEAGITSAVYKAEEDDPEAARTTLELAASGGAGLVVAMGESVAEATLGLQSRYPEIQFVLLGAGWQPRLLGNAAALQFSAAQPGWLAGYLAVYEAQKSPIALVRTEDPTATVYALGFLLGAQQAAEDLRQAPEETVVFTLDLAEEMTEEERAGLLAAACEEGAILFFVADPALEEEVLAAARTAGTRVMATALPLETTPAALTQVQHDAKTMVQAILAQWKEERFPGGREVTGGLWEGSVQLLAELARFEHVGERRYNTALAKFEDGTLAARLEGILSPEGGALPAAEELELPLLALKVPGQEEQPGENGTGGQSASLPPPPGSSLRSPPRSEQSENGGPNRAPL